MSEPSTHNELRADGLTKSYRHRCVLDNFSTRIVKGRVLALLGRNGSGKTTAFRIISGALGATSGRVFMTKGDASQDLTSLDMAKRSKLGLVYLPQEPSVFRGLTAWQNIELVLQLRHGRRRSYSDRIESLAKSYGIWHLISSRTGTLSGGERRRVEIVRSLALDPEYLILDEPLAGVDPISISAIQALISALAKSGVGVVITDHNARDTLSIADDVQVLQEGRVCFHGSAREAMESNIAREAYLGRTFQP